MKYFTRTFLSRKYLNIIFLLSASFVLMSCSSGRNEDITLSDDDSDKTYVFSEDGTEWKVRIQDEKITELYKDGSGIPASDIHKYEDKIHRKIERFENDMAEFKDNMSLFHNDMDAYKKEMAEMRKEMNRHNFAFDFDSEQFSKDMKKASEEIQLAFASADFRESMQELHKNLQNIKINVDMDEVNEQIRDAAEQMKDINIDIDLSELNENLAQLREELKDKKSEMKGARKHFNRFSRFIDDLKDELEDDGVIEDANEDINLTFNSEELIIDGKKVPDDLHRKYKRMFEERFGKMDENMSIKQTNHGR